MDGVLALLREDKNTNPVDRDTILTGPSPPTTDTSYSAGHGSPSSGLSGSVSQQSRFSIIQPMPSLKPNDDDLDIIDRGVLTIAEAEVLLEKFKTVKTPHFPFVVIPPTTNAMALRQQSPFLFLAVMTACLEDNLPLQRKLESEVKQVLGRRLLISGQNQLELLQGVLVHLCWNHYHFHPSNKNIFMLLHVAAGIVIQLGLDRSPVNQIHLAIIGHCKAQYESHGTKQKWMPPEKEPSQVAAETRAFLGCFYTSSV